MPTTNVDICNRALQMAAARAAITSLSDGSNEAENCNMLFVPIRDQVLGMAFWNFARKTINMNLLKAAPGTPESPTVTALQWTPSYPAPPWFYEYQYPSDCIQFRYILGQPSSVVAVNSVPVFATPQFTFDPLLAGVPQKFDVATDVVGPAKVITNITVANPPVVTSAAHGFTNGDSIWITGVIGMTQINNQLYTVANATTNTYELSGANSTQYSAYITGGIAVNQTQSGSRQTIILSNAQGAVGCYTMLITDYDLWPAQALQAFITALAGFLAIPLSGDKELAKMLVGQANNHILQARATDGNEGFTIQDYTPDWIAVRGNSYPLGGLGGNQYVTPYPPLFSIS